MVYAVIDTNVIVSAAIAKNPENSIPSKVVEFLEILAKEYL